MEVTVKPSLKMYMLVLALCISGIILIGLHNLAIGWPAMIVTGIASLYYTWNDDRKYLLLAITMMAIVGLTPINTDIRYSHALLMALLLAVTIALPYIVSTHIYRDNIIGLPLQSRRRWHRTELLYILLTAVVAYVLLPFYFAHTGAYRYWTVEPGTSSLVRLFSGTNILGIWDELVFVGTLLSLSSIYTVLAG